MILTYLVSAFGKSEHEHLYPKDVNKRAIVDLFLQFDLSTLYQRVLEYFFPTIALGKKKLEKSSKLLKAPKKALQKLFKTIIKFINLAFVKFQIQKLIIFPFLRCTTWRN